MALIISWAVLKKPDISMALNGALAGLVAITCPCDGVSPTGAIIIGGIAGILVVFSVLFFDYVMKIDDPVGAISVHAINGLWGTLSYGLFAMNGGLFYGGGFKQFGVQLLGAATAFVWAFGLGLILFGTLSKTVGLRVSAEEELKGLDIGEHGNEAYAGFQIFVTT
jgi:Amt family ammonium transporter